MLQHALINTFSHIVFTIYLEITFCVLKFGGKSSLLSLFAVINFAIVTTTSGFIIALIHIRGLVDIEQWCVEIGDFNGCSQLSIAELYLNMHNNIHMF